MRRGNITAGFEDNIRLSNTFLDKYAKKSEQSNPIQPTPVKNPVSTPTRLTKHIASKEALLKIGFSSEGTGIYKDSSHHLWKLSREGEGYSITRVAEEDTILNEKKVANKVATTLSISSDSDLTSFFSNLDQSGVYYNKISENRTTEGYTAVVDVDSADVADFTSIASDSGIRTAGNHTAGEASDDVCSKVFSDEAVLTGISHYINMGYDKKEAVNNFIISNTLDKTHYTPLINEVLDRYNY